MAAVGVEEFLWRDSWRMKGEEATLLDLGEEVLLRCGSVWWSWSW